MLYSRRIFAGGQPVSDNWKEVNVTWKGQSLFTAENESGGSMEMASGRSSEMLSPMELVLASLAGCTGVDIVSILEKKRIILDDFKVRVRAKRADEYPKIYTEYHVEYLFWGKGIQTKDVEQAIQLSNDKYCSVSAMLKPGADFHYSYQILNPGETA
jgi:putative redox protein